LLPVHWGTFNLGLHPWDDPVETLVRLAQESDAQLVLPKLGEPVEPAHDRRVDAWWRVVDARGRSSPAVPQTSLPKEMPWPID
jgi:hypothetical protein